MAELVFEFHYLNPCLKIAEWSQSFSHFVARKGLRVLLKCRFLELPARPRTPGVLRVGLWNIYLSHASQVIIPGQVAGAGGHNLTNAALLLIELLRYCFKSFFAKSLSVKEVIFLSSLWYDMYYFFLRKKTLGSS